MNVQLEVADSEYTAASNDAANSNTRRIVFLKWLRKTHGWIGLWGATLGLFVGTTGMLLNHRSVLKIPAAQTQESSFEMALPANMPSDARALAVWLKQELKLDRPASRVRSEPSRIVPWGDKTLKQPARWVAMFSSPAMNVQAEYWVGNSFVSIKRNDNNFFATLTNLHKGNGVGVGWVLLVDTIAGGMIMLSLTGVLLWMLINKRRVIGVSIALISLCVTLTLGLIQIY